MLSRDTRLLFIGAALAALAMLLGFALATMYATAVGAHPCVGQWRVDQWNTAAETSSVVVEVPQRIVTLDVCGTVHAVATPSVPRVPPPAGVAASPPTTLAVDGGAVAIAGPLPSPQTAPPSTTTSAPPTTAPQAPPTGTQQWAWLIDHYFLPADRTWAHRVMQCESGGRSDARNPRSTATGLMQFLAGTWRWVAPQAGVDPDLDARLDPEQNVRAAAWLFYNDGPQHWVCR